MKVTLLIITAVAAGLVNPVSAADFSTAEGSVGISGVTSLSDNASDNVRTAFYRSRASELLRKNQINGEAGSAVANNDRLIWTNPVAWMEQEVTAADGQADDLFGFRVLISGDTAFVSAPAPIYRPGSVYVFSNFNGTWTQTQKLVADPDVTPPPNWSDFFGWSLALSGDTLLVGAPFTFGTQGPTGAAFVFTEVNGSWQQSQELIATDGVATDYFGQAVGLDGSTAVIGAYNKNGGEGAAYIFTNSSGLWSQSQELMASDGAPNDSHQFGESLGFDGQAVIIGAPGPDYVSTDVYPQGAAYVFTNQNGSWSQSQKLTATDGLAGDQFGFDIDLAAKTALIGSPAANIGSNPHQGAAYIFGRTGSLWAQSAKLTASDGVAYDQFGQSVALQGKRALIGEWSHDDNPNHTPPPPKQGESYLFKFNGSSWTQRRPFTAADGAPGDSFGWDVDLDRGILLIGAQGTVDGNVFQGSAYFFERGGN